MARDHQYFVYIVQCSDNSYYTGVTNDVERRLWEHNEGISTKRFTYKRRPVQLMYWQRFTDIHQAISWEKQLQGWSRKKKEALFIEDWNKIIELAKNSKAKSSTHQVEANDQGIEPSTSSG